MSLQVIRTGRSILPTLLAIVLLSTAARGLAGPSQPENRSRQITPPSDRSHQITDLELKRFLQQNITASTHRFDKYDAEVWLESMLARMAIYKLEKNEALNILKAVYRESNASGLQADLVLSVIEIESSFNRYAVSRAGAQGLMQVMPFWKNEIGRPDDNLTSIDQNIRYGCKILQYYLQKAGGNLMEALARYNGSYGRTSYPEKVLLAWEKRWKSATLAD